MMSKKAFFMRSDQWDGLTLQPYKKQNELWYHIICDRHCVFLSSECRMQMLWLPHCFLLQPSRNSQVQICSVRRSKYYCASHHFCLMAALIPRTRMFSPSLFTWAPLMELLLCSTAAMIGEGNQSFQSRALVLKVWPNQMAMASDTKS